MARPRRGGSRLLIATALAAAALAAHHTNSNADNGSEYVAPVDGGRVTSGFGPRWGAFHGGTDIAAPVGTPIRAITNGTVTEAGPASGFGLWLHIRHHDDTVSVYGHMHTITVDRGQRVRAGEQIATVGARGDSTGPHLHLEIWPHGDRTQRIDPTPWLTRHGVHLTKEHTR